MDEYLFLAWIVTEDWESSVDIVLSYIKDSNSYNYHEFCGYLNDKILISRNELNDDTSFEADDFDDVIEEYFKRARVQFNKRYNTE